MAEKKKKYEYESDETTSAREALEKHEASAPVYTTSPWQNVLDDTMRQIHNRKPFEYDVNGDMLLKQYQDRYMQQGRIAAQDVMGQAASMTGGFGNSNAIAVGNQAYQGYLQGINDKIPELYSLALSKYNAETDDLINKASIAKSAVDTEYDRYRDAVADHNAQRAILQGKYDNSLAEDYTLMELARQSTTDKRADAEFYAKYGDYSKLKDLGIDTTALEASLEASGDIDPGDGGNPMAIKDWELVDTVAAYIEDYGTDAGYAYLDGMVTNETITPEVRNAILDTLIAMGVIKPEVDYSGLADYPGLMVGTEYPYLAVHPDLLKYRSETK